MHGQKNIKVYVYVQMAWITYIGCTPVKRSHFLVGLLQDVKKAFLGVYETLVLLEILNYIYLRFWISEKSTYKSTIIAQICMSGIAFILFEPLFSRTNLQGNLN